ncbi:hypothetical protein ACIBFB_20350 [Nocardiopsis sp. NPDC050513]|uniref:hypothetical protein n=1 Tax=Nocardiopsis sp. NPDC050513 TaxID=3364338 RepID=UPI00378A4168
MRWNIACNHRYLRACVRKVRVCSGVHTITSPGTVPSACHRRTRSGVHTIGLVLGHDGNRTCEAMFTPTGRSRRHTASDSALRHVARIRCLVGREITR